MKIFSGMVLLAVVMLFGAQSQTAHAAYEGGRLIDDDFFLNSSTMDIGTIQNFLASKGSGLTNMSFVFDCVGAGSTANTAYINAGAPCGQNASSATIIYYASQIYGTNPQVILATLQKEQSLITTPNPSSWQINQAMGYGCPDNGGCGASDFFYQIDNGAWVLRFHMERARGNMTYWYNSSSWVCGSAKHYYTPSLYPNQNVTFIDDDGVYYQTFFMTNAASSSMYCYTPHAYNNPNGLYGLPAYGTTGRYYTGSYNFVTYFERWFGSTKSGAPLTTSAVSLSTTEATVGQPITATYTIRNPFSYAITVPSIGISNRMNGQMYDFGIQTNVNFAAGETKTFSSTFTTDVPGPFRMQAVYNIYQGWYGGNYSWLNVHQPSLSVTARPSVSPEFPIVNTAPTITFTIKNTGGLTAYPTNLMAANLDGTTPRGYAAVSVSLAPGQSYTYSVARNIDSTRQQTSWIAYQLGKYWYRLGDDITYRAYTTPADLQLTTPITVSPSDLAINEPATATFKVKNLGDQPIRLSNLGLGVVQPSDNKRFDFNSQTNGIPGTIAGGKEYTYKATRTFPTKDIYNLFITGSYDGTNFSGGILSSPTHPTNINVQTYNSPANITVTTPIRTQQSAGPLSQIVDLTYTVTNTGDAPTGDIILAFYCRQNATIYCDIPGRAVNLDSGESTTMTRSVAYFSPGTLTFKPLKYARNTWQDFGQSTQVDIRDQVPTKNTFTANLSLDRSTATAGSTVTATYTIKNNSSSDLQLPVYAVAARLNGAFYDFGLQNWFFLRAGETKTFTAQITPTLAGTYTLFPVLRTAGESWYGYSEQKLIVQ